jgi:hypothetical protein
MVGGGKLIGKVAGAEVPGLHPVALGFTTRIEAVPTLAMRPAGTTALSDVVLVKVVVRALAFHWTADCAQKFVPVTLSVKAGEPAVALAGFSEVMAGPGGLTAKFAAADVPGLQPAAVGLVTVTATDLGEATSEVGIAALSDVELTKLVTTEVPPKLTEDWLQKPVPETFSVNGALPATIDCGVSVVTVTAGATVDIVQAPGVLEMKPKFPLKFGVVSEKSAPGIKPVGLFQLVCIWVWAGAV